MRVSKLLVIDASLDFQLLIQSYVEDCGIFCLAAMDFLQALAISSRELPDLILLDIDLPGGGGLLLLDRLRANLRTSEIPVFVMTEQTTPGLEFKARSQGARAFFHKPIHKEALIDTIRNVVVNPPPPQV